MRSRVLPTTGRSPSAWARRRGAASRRCATARLTRAPSPRSGARRPTRRAVPEAAQDLSPSGYAAVLAEFAARGYTATGFAEASSAARHLILRHDVDFSLEAAAA